jgi:ribosome-binding protein aMBF1 (putative translation factor)
MLKWSLAELSEKSGIGTTTLKRFEAADGVPNGHMSTFSKLKELFADAGIELIGTPDDQPGVRLKK